MNFGRDHFSLISLKKFSLNFDFQTPTCLDISKGLKLQLGDTRRTNLQSFSADGNINTNKRDFYVQSGYTDSTFFCENFDNFYFQTLDTCPGNKMPALATCIVENKLNRSRGNYCCNSTRTSVPSGQVREWIILYPTLFYRAHSASV